MNYLKIDQCNMNNGDGLRCVVWLTGCDHKCYNCFNPETWDKNNGDRFGREQIDLICSTLSQPWCSGLTLTGGDPLYHCNIVEVINLCKFLKAKFPTKNIWVYTGYQYQDKHLNLHEEILHYIDVLVDGEYVDEKKSPFAKWVGSSNQRVIDVQKSLAQNKIVLWEE